MTLVWGIGVCDAVCVGIGVCDVVWGLDCVTCV